MNPSAPDSTGVITTKFEIGMTCSGCANAVKRICSKIEGITEVDADLDNKMLTIKSMEGQGPTTSFVLEKLMKWGEAAEKSVALAQ